MTTKKSYKDIYNESYSSFTPILLNNNREKIESYLFENNKSIIQFIKDYFSTKGGLEGLKDKSVLEVGCGLGGVSHFLSSYCENITAVDISELAIANAKHLANLKNIPIDFIVADLTKDTNLDKKFDYIIDSHLLHCLTGKSARQNYFNFIQNHLKNKGAFLAESMVYNENFEEPLGYELTQDYNLLKDISGEKTPIRTLYPAIEIESELVANNFKITYFYYHQELSFNLFPEYTTYPEFRLPKLIRLCAQSK